MSPYIKHYPQSGIAFFELPSLSLENHIPLYLDTYQFVPLIRYSFIPIFRSQLSWGDVCTEILA